MCRFVRFYVFDSNFIKKYTKDTNIFSKFKEKYGYIQTGSECMRKQFKSVQSLFLTIKPKVLA